MLTTGTSLAPPRPLSFHFNSFEFVETIPVTTRSNLPPGSARNDLSTSVPELLATGATEIAATEIKMLPITLPNELWLYIADLVPPRERPKLVGVNRLFFNMIMNELYGQLSFISADSRIFTDKLRSLQGPTGTMGDRVRVLTLWPAAVRDAIRAVESQKARKAQEDKRPATRQGHNRTGSASQLIQRGRQYVGELLRHPRSQSPTPWVLPPSQGSMPSPEERLHMFLDAVKNLTKVEEYEISWYVDKGGKEYGWKFAFFGQIWTSIGPNLRRLTIDAQLFKLSDILSTTGPLPRLEELNLTLRNEAIGEDPYQTTLVSRNSTVVPYFLNKLTPSLHTLSIKTIGHQELAFFGLLGQFPNLTKLSLIMPLDAHHLYDYVGFQSFLLIHPRIRELSIRYSRCCRDVPDDGFRRADGTGHLLYTDIVLPVVHSLEYGLRLPISRWGPHPMLSAVAKMCTESLTSLTLTDRSLTIEEAKTVLGAFPSWRLKKLSLFARLLSPQLIDAIAHACPVLGSLTLDVGTVVKSEVLNSTYPKPKDDVNGFAEALMSYAVDLDNDRWRYRGWTLSDISVMKWEFKVGHQCSWPCMHAIAAVVPTVRSFAGKGDMMEDTVVRKPQDGNIGADWGNRERPWDT
ncbi:unnamed protein product [Cyclocybe aegerita]|uniref:F-box domain-containing protein n=1 Tax=Cyclocybe aegerita TaxID=1973307 RepID=A0A8S0XRD7_CYCAE|nr:unnamed protein product [Cyclocybe aegerita]